MAHLSKPHSALSNAAPKKQKTQTWDPTRLLGYHCLEAQLIEVSSTPRRLLTPVKRTPNRLFRPPKSSKRRRSSNTTHVSSQPTSALCDTEEDLNPETIFNPVESDADKVKPNTTADEASEPLLNSDTASSAGLPSTFATVTLDPASQGGAPSTTNQFTTTLASSKKRKAVHFADSLKDTEPTPARLKRIFLRSHVENSEQDQELLHEFRKVGSLNDAIWYTGPTVVRKIARSLNKDLALSLVHTIVPEVRMTARNSNKPRPSAEKVALLKQALLRFLDGKTHKRYLCRDCEIFHSIPKKRYVPDPDNPDENYRACASQYIIGYRQLKGRPFPLPFRFSQIQFAMKLYRQGMYYNSLLVSPLHGWTIDFFLGLTIIRSSEVYPVKGRLLNRMQHWFHISPDIENPLSKAELIEECLETDITENRLAVLCRHLNKKSIKYTLWDFENHDNDSKVRKCDFCALEYRFDWYYVGKYGSGIVLTIWRDFGQCLTPFDPRWMAHFDEFKDKKYITKFKKDLGREAAFSSTAQPKPRWHDDMEPAAPDWAVGTIQKMFEGNEGLDLQECIRIMLEPERRQPADFVSLPEERIEGYKKMGLAM